MRKEGKRDDYLKYEGFQVCWEYTFKRELEGTGGS